MPQPLSLAFDDFEDLRKAGRTYIDKTALIPDLLTHGAKVTLFCRPRRFGKSLLLSTLRYFMEAAAEDRSALFADLEVWKSTQARAHFQKYPVVTLDLKGVRGTSWEELREGIAGAVAKEAERHDYLQHSPRLNEIDQAEWLQLREAKAPPLELARSLQKLTRLLQKHWGQPAWVLVDEYDAPIHQGWLHGCYEPTIQFFRVFYGEAFKGNRSLAQGVLTGVLKVAKEGIFSSFNNPQVVTVLDAAYATAFGFTEVEVEQLRQLSGSAATIEELRSWYNGYRIGGATIYNPWSILCCLQSPDTSLQPYWVETSSHDVLGEMIRRGSIPLQEQLARWLSGHPLVTEVVDTLLLRTSTFTDPELCTMLLHAGYFTIQQQRRIPGTLEASLIVPNRDVVDAFWSLSRRWLQQHTALSTPIPALCAAMLAGDVARFGHLLADVVARSAGLPDINDNPTKSVFPEQFYHAFVLGLLVQLEGSHRVESNRDSGLGRPDVAVIPKQPGQPGVILEFKKKRGKVETTLAEAEAQIRQERYRMVLDVAGAQPIYVYAVVFEGKRVTVRLVDTSGSLG